MIKYFDNVRSYQWMMDTCCSFAEHSRYLMQLQQKIRYMQNRFYQSKIVIKECAIKKVDWSNPNTNTKLTQAPYPASLPAPVRWKQIPIQIPIQVPIQVQIPTQIPTSNSPKLSTQLLSLLQWDGSLPFRFQRSNYPLVLPQVHLFHGNK